MHGTGSLALRTFSTFCHGISRGCPAVVLWARSAPATSPHVHSPMGGHWERKNDQHRVSSVA